MSTTKMKEFSDAVLDVCKSYYADVDELRAACAAGPWRFDVENAPKSGVIWVLAKSGEYRAVAFCPVRDCWIDDDYHIWQHNMECFAVPNPPQVTT